VYKLDILDPSISVVKQFNAVFISLFTYCVYMLQLFSGHVVFVKISVGEGRCWLKNSIPAKIQRYAGRPLPSSYIPKLPVFVIFGMTSFAVKECMIRLRLCSSFVSDI